MTLGLSATLAILFFVSLWRPLLAQEQRSESPATELERIVISATRSEVDEGDVCENMEMADEVTMPGMPNTGLTGILQYIPGVDIEPRSNPAQPSSLSIQGSDSRQVRMMIDGIPLNSQSSGQVNPSLYPVSDISRIEVIRGPGSSAWGSSLGGVVNIITRDTGTTPVPRGTFTSSAGGYDTARESGELWGKALGVGYYVMGEHLDSGGKGVRDDALNRKYFNKFTRDLPDGGRLLFSFGYGSDDVNTRFPDQTWQAILTQTRYGKFGLEDDFGGTRVKAELKHSRQDIVSRSFPGLETDIPSWEVLTADRLSELSITASRTVRDADTLVAGADLGHDSVVSRPYLDHRESLFLAAPFVNYTFRAGPWDLVFGSRYDHNSEFGNELSPSFGTVYRPGDAWSSVFRTRVSRAFNAPPLLWKFNDNPGLGVAPNPAIRAERGIVYEAEAETIPVSWLRFKLSGYRADIRDALASDEVEPGIFMMRNFEKFRRQGVELQTKLSLSSDLKLFGAGFFNDIENRATRTTVKGGGKPRHGFDAGIEYANRAGFSLNVTGYYKRWNSPAYLEANDRKFIADMKASQRVGKNILVFFYVYNITNSSYWSDNYYPLRARYYEGGVTLSW